MFFVICSYCLQMYQPFRKILSETQSECQTDWIQNMPDELSDLILVQSVSKGYEKTTWTIESKVNYTEKNKER